MGIIKLLNNLNNNNTKLTFILTIPIWDLEGKKIMKELYNNDIEKQNIDYGDFEIINIVKSSIYLNEESYSNQAIVSQFFFAF